MQEWKNIPILKTLYDRIKKILGATGYNSVASYVAEAIRLRLKEDENRLEEREYDRQQGEKLRTNKEEDLDN